MNPRRILSLTGRETKSLTQSQHPNPALTCEVSPSLTQSHRRSHSQSHSLSTLGERLLRLATETRRRTASDPMHRPAFDGPHASWMPISNAPALSHAHRSIDDRGREWTRRSIRLGIAAALSAVQTACDLRRCWVPAWDRWSPLPRSRVVSPW